MGKQSDDINRFGDIEATNGTDVPLDDITRPTDREEPEDVYVEVVSLPPVGDAASTDVSDQSDLAGESDIQEQVARIEETRAEMSETIDAIQQRLSPETVREQAVEAVRDAAVGQVERITGDANERAGRVASSIMAMIERHPAEVATGVTTVLAAAVAVGVRQRLRQVEESEEAPASRADMLTHQVQSLAARIGPRAETQVGTGVQRVLPDEITAGARHVIDEIRMALLVLAPVAAGVWLARRLMERRQRG